MIYNIHQPLGLVAVHPVKQPNGKFSKTTLVITKISHAVMSCIGTPGISLVSKWAGLKQANSSYYLHAIEGHFSLSNLVFRQHVSIMTSQKGQQGSRMCHFLAPCFECFYKKIGAFLEGILILKICLCGILDSVPCMLIIPFFQTRLLSSTFSESTSALFYLMK